MPSMTDMLLDRLGDSGLESLSGSLGSNPRATKTVAATALPMVLAALGRNAPPDDGASAFGGVLDRDGDGKIADDLLGGLGRSLFGRG